MNSQSIKPAKSLLLSALFLSTALVGISSYAETSNIIRTPAPVKQAVNTGNWIAITPQYGDWVNVGAPYECTGVFPKDSNYTIGVRFTQVHSGCKQDMTRTVQNREQNNVTLAVRIAGAETVESRTENDAQYAVESIGTRDNLVINYGAETWYWAEENAYFVGIYARENMASVGDLTINEHGDRVLAYTLLSPKECLLRFAATGVNGWGQPGENSTPTRNSYVNAIKRANLYDAYGNLYGTYTFGNFNIDNSGGAIKSAPIPCSMAASFYDNPSMFSRIELLKN